MLDDSAYHVKERGSGNCYLVDYPVDRSVDYGEVLIMIMGFVFPIFPGVTSSICGLRER